MGVQRPGKSKVEALNQRFVLDREPWRVDDSGSAVADDVRAMPEPFVDKVVDPLHGSPRTLSVQVTA
jgi:hypothetical protein